MKLFDKFDMTFLINLKKREDRLNEFISQVNHYDLGNFEVFEAVDGSLIENNHNTLNNGEVGIIHSTINILKKSIEKNYKTILIIEDDCRFNDNIYIVDDYIKLLPDDWDFVYFGANHNTHSGASNVNRVNEKVIRVYNTYAAHCVLIHKKMFKVLIEELSKFNYQSDVVYQKLQHNYNFYSFSPLIATQSPGFSNIQNKDVDYISLIT
jgi:GR25 family glycosyltransferase involved in LPS biosynthesis